VIKALVEGRRAKPYTYIYIYMCVFAVCLLPSHCGYVAFTKDMNSLRYGVRNNAKRDVGRTHTQFHIQSDSYTLNIFEAVFSKRVLATLLTSVFKQSRGGSHHVNGCV